MYKRKTARPIGGLPFYAYVFFICYLLSYL